MPAFCGRGRSHVGSGMHRSQSSPGSQAGPGLTQRSADLLRRWCLPPSATHPPSWQVVGC